MKRLIGFGLILAVVAVVGATAVEANCIPAQSIGTRGWLIWYGEPGTDVSNFVGNFWNTGNKAGTNGDALALEEWFYQYAGYTYYFGIDGNLGDYRVPGCPADGTNMTVVLDNCVSGEAMIMTTSQRPQYGAPQWDFALQGTYVYAVAASSPRPRIVSSSRAGTTVNVNYDVPTTATDAVFDDTGGSGAATYAVYSTAAANGATPDLNSTDGWALQSSGIGAGAAALDCANIGEDQWLATAVTISGDTQLTCPVRVECDPTLADPGGPGPAGIKKIKRPRGTPQRDSQQ